MIKYSFGQTAGHWAVKGYVNSSVPLHFSHAWQSLSLCNRVCKPQHQSSVYKRTDVLMNANIYFSIFNHLHEKQLLLKHHLISNSGW